MSPRYIQWTLPDLLYQTSRKNPLVYKGLITYTITYYILKLVFLTLGVGVGYLFVETDDSCLVVRGSAPGPSLMLVACLKREIRILKAISK